MKITQVESKWLFENMGKIDILNILSPEEREKLIDQVTPMILMGNQPVIREGEAGKAFFIIFNGRVSVWVERNGKEAKLATLQSGDYFGEISLLTGQKTTANVIATAPTKVFFLDSNQFISMIRSNPELADHIKSVMKERLEHRKNEVLEMTRMDNLETVNKAISDFLKS